MELITAVWIFLIGTTFGAMLCFAIDSFISDGKPKKKGYIEKRSIWSNALRYW